MIFKIFFFHLSCSDRDKRKRKKAKEKQAKRDRSVRYLGEGLVTANDANLTVCL
jgi:hypothetical protein